MGCGKDGTTVTRFTKKRKTEKSREKSDYLIQTVKQERKLFRIRKTGGNVFWKWEGKSISK